MTSGGFGEWPTDWGTTRFAFTSNTGWVRVRLAATAYTASLSALTDITQEVVDAIRAFQLKREIKKISLRILHFEGLRAVSGHQMVPLGNHPVPLLGLARGTLRHSHIPRRGH